MKAQGLFKLDMLDVIAIVCYVVISMVLFIEPLRNAYWNGLNGTLISLTILSILVPVYTISVAYQRQKKHEQDKKNADSNV